MGAGDYQWLNSKPDKIKTVSQFLDDYVDEYKNFMSKNKLADYGGINNLLECVSSYVHEVASLNAANIANLKYASELYHFLGDENKSKILLNSCSPILEALNDLYVEGKGYWRARQPDGTLFDVRHAYDFFTVINTIGDLYLKDRQKNEMVSFFLTELKTEKWMRALSESDNDAVSFSSETFPSASFNFDSKSDKSMSTKFEASSIRFNAASRFSPPLSLIICSLNLQNPVFSDLTLLTYFTITESASAPLPLALSAKLFCFFAILLLS